MPVAKIPCQLQFSERSGKGGETKGSKSMNWEYGLFFAAGYLTCALVGLFERKRSHVALTETFGDRSISVQAPTVGEAQRLLALALSLSIKDQGVRDHGVRDQGVLPKPTVGPKVSVPVRGAGAGERVGAQGAQG
jgi:hypothetical protein